MVPEFIWIIFLFALGASIGSFLNVVVYRLPLGLSLVSPSSHCPACKHPIVWYDNIPIFAWFFLRGKCRHCQQPFSFKYPMVELFTAVLFVVLYLAYFVLDARDFMPEFQQGGWLIYGGHILLVCVLLASSLIDGRHWIIPLSVSYTAALVGFSLSGVWPYALEGVPAGDCWRLIPYATASQGAIGLGAFAGLGIGLLMLKTRMITRSFIELDDAMEAEAKKARQQGRDFDPFDFPIKVNIRREMVREIVFLTPAIVLGWLFSVVLTGNWDNETLKNMAQWWQDIFAAAKWAPGLLGSLFGFVIGGAVVWGTRILGSLAFGKEAMGLGDVHLMAAVGAVLGWSSPTLAFLIAPFFGLGWAIFRLIFKGSREIPYGPFLSLATIVVMIFSDPLVNYFSRAFGMGMIGR